MTSRTEKMREILRNLYISGRLDEAEGRANTEQIQPALADLEALMSDKEQYQCPNLIISHGIGLSGGVEEVNFRCKVVHEMNDTFPIKALMPKEDKPLFQCNCNSNPCHCGGYKYPKSQEVKMSDLITSIDARVWAKEFMRIYTNKMKNQNPPDIDWIDESLMIGWFANAIMAGYDEASRRAKSQEPREN